VTHEAVVIGDRAHFAQLDNAIAGGADAREAQRAISRFVLERTVASGRVPLRRA